MWSVMLCFSFLLFFFFFKQKTAYEMRISDWSSDVFSSDLLFADGEDREAPRPCPSGDVGGTRIVRPDDSRTAGRNDLIEQAHLGFEIAFHVAMIIEMVTAEIRERACLHRQTFGAILRKAVAGCFEGRMRNAFAPQTRHVGKEGHDVRRGEAGRDLVHGGGNAQRDRKAVV